MSGPDVEKNQSMLSLATSERTEFFTESVIREMTRLALEHNAVNLAQGFPDYDLPEVMKKGAIEAIEAGLNQYAITWGTKNLREAIAKKFKAVQGLEISPETEVTVTCGSTEAMIASLFAIVNPSDEVIVFEPFYENYGPDAVLSSAITQYVSMKPPSKDSKETEWTFDFDELKAAFNDKTKAIIINTPNNPTGKVFTRKELEFIAELCQKWNVFVITDEIYDHMVYDGLEHISMVTLPGMRERTITINAISKTYSATGWRVGWAVAPPAITKSIRKVHDFLTVGAPHPLQEGAAKALGLPQDYYKKLLAAYVYRREFLLKTLQNAGFEAWKPYGAYYIMVDFTDLWERNQEKWKLNNELDFAHWMAREIGVAAVPGNGFYRIPFYGRTKLRFSFGRRNEVLQEAAAKLAKLK